MGCTATEDGQRLEISEGEKLYYLCRENKGADQLICVFVFAYAKKKQVLKVRDDCPVKFANLQYFTLAPLARFYRVPDEAFIAET